MNTLQLAQEALEEEIESHLEYYCAGLDETELTKLVPSLKLSHKNRRKEIESIITHWCTWNAGGNIQIEDLDDHDMKLLIWFRLRHAIQLIKQEIKKEKELDSDTHIDDVIEYYLIHWWKESEELFWTWALDTWNQN